MPTFYNFRENGFNYSFDDIFIPIDLFRVGNLWTWGNNSDGQLGNASTTDRSTPVITFAGGNNWRTISSGFAHVAAIKADGTLWTWGRANNGELGNGLVINDVSTPITTFAGGTNWKQVSSGRDHTAAIKTDGTLWTWGENVSGQLGINNTLDTRSTPATTFAGGTNWKQVSSGFQYIAAIKTDGTLWTWGTCSDGRLGNGITTGDILTPITTFAGGTNWKQVSAGQQHASAIKDDGTLWIWGANSAGQLGNAIVAGDRSTPITTFAGGTDWKQVSCGSLHAAAIKTDGTLWLWGRGNNGRLGNGITIGDRSTPATTFAGGTNWKQVSAGDDFNIAIKTDGTLWTWGLGSSGQLGNASITDVSTPVTTFAGGTYWKEVSGRGSNSGAVTYDDDPSIPAL